MTVQLPEPANLQPSIQPNTLMHITHCSNHVLTLAKPVCFVGEPFKSSTTAAQQGQGTAAWAHAGQHVRVHGTAYWANAVQRGQVQSGTRAEAGQNRAACTMVKQHSQTKSAGQKQGQGSR